MPLIKSGSEKARRENTRREIDAGKPVRQAVAIGYAEQRRSGEQPRHAREVLSRDHVSKWVRGERKESR